MRYLGIDLAWGTRNPTGLAVLDGAGTLLDVDRAVTDDEIQAWARPSCAGPVRVGVDAPIAVPNATGARPCERMVGRWFGRYGASCHPANTSMPVFAAGTRAQRILDALGLDGDPHADRATSDRATSDRATSDRATSDRATSDRRAWEVYPHQAAVVLFDLPGVLRYKAKPGRELPGLRAELLRLMELLESLDARGPWPPLDVSACAAWHRLRDGVRTAATKAALRRCEDPVDAVLAAYVAYLADVRPDATRVFGDGPGGHILCVVTPELARRIDASSGLGP